MKDMAIKDRRVIIITPLIGIEIGLPSKGFKDSRGQGKAIRLASLQAWKICNPRLYILKDSEVPIDNPLFSGYYLSVEIKPATEPILIEFSKAVKAIGLYPEGHPTLDTIIERGFTYLKGVLNQRQEDINWTIDRNGFYENGVLLCKGNKGISLLANEVFLRRIKGVRFSNLLTLSEWKGFIRLLRLDPPLLQEMGGVGNLLKKDGVRGVLVDELRYEEIVKWVTDLKEEGEGVDLIEGPEKAAGEERGEKPLGESPAGTPLMETTPTKEESLEELLLALEKEGNPTEYDNLVKKVVIKGRPLRDEKRWEGLLPILIAFATHAWLQPHRQIEGQNSASRGLMELLSQEMIGYLIHRLCQPQERDREAIQQILLRTGEEGVRTLLTALIDADEINTRRLLFNTLVSFGEKARLPAEAMLEDPRWFVVRQMVSLLGEIGNPQSLEVLKGLFTHPDLRVKKGVLKAMVKIDPQEAVPLLLATLKGGNKGLILEAIVLLGGIRDDRGTSGLIDIASKGGWFFSMGIRKEAVKALGAIGDKRAIPALTKLLKRTSWFNKQAFDELRCMTANSLARIGGEEARKAIEETVKCSTGIVHHTCIRILERE